MPVFRIPAEHLFPPPELADPSGLLGVGGDLAPARVLLAYRHGIFPWFSEGQPIYWWSPDPRTVLYPRELRVQRSLAKRIRQRRFRLTMDAAFDEVVGRCARTPRPGQDGTWITDSMREAYHTLHLGGVAHSVEAWQGDTLVGGLYGVSMGTVFAGESMFTDVPDASKVAFACFVHEFERWGGSLIDCQMPTPHLERFGARAITRSAYLAALSDGRDRELATKSWAFADALTWDGRPRGHNDRDHDDRIW